MRAREGLFLLEGPVVVRDALRAGVVFRDAFIRAGDPELAELHGELRAAGFDAVEVGENVLKAVADTSSPQGVVAVAETPRFSLSDLSAEADLVLVLDQVRDPGNAGAMIRSAAAAGADCVVLTSGSVDAFGPKTVRASAGSAFKVPVVSSDETGPVIERLRAAGFMLVAGSGTAETHVYDVDLTGKVGVLVGNEAWGFSGPAAENADVTAGIPMEPGVESLNVAVAASILLFEVVRQRRLSSARHG